MGDYRPPEAANLADLRRCKLAVATPRDARNRSGRGCSRVGSPQRSESGAATWSLATAGWSGNHARESVSLARHEARTCGTSLEIAGPSNRPLERTGYAGRSTP